MFIAALFVTARKYEQPKCPSTDQWRNKMWFIHIMEYYSAIKRNEVVIYATMPMSLENSERSQTQKVT